MRQPKGVLDVELISDRTGTTRVVRREQRFPLHLTVPMYLDDRIPGMAFIYVQNPSGAVFGDDRLSLRVAASNGAKVHITTTSATKLHRMCGGPARQQVTLEVKGRSYVEYIPDPLIPQAESSYEQSTTIALDSGSMVVASEIIAPGRLARGESFAFRKLRLDTQVIIDGSTELIDSLAMEPSDIPVDVIGVLGSYYYAGSLLTLAPGRDNAGLAVELSRMAQEGPDFQLGTGLLPGAVGVLVRVLARSSATVKRLIDQAWACSRAEMIGAPLPMRRK
ncbi:MAG: urease accessory protein UreD [Dongiaceae bacterium]